MFHVKLITLLILWQSFLGACTDHTDSHADGQLVSKTPLIESNKVNALVDIAQHIYEKYPPQRYIYVYIGQSPSAIYALLSVVGDKLAVKPTQIAIPLSRGILVSGQITPRVEYDGQRILGGVDYLKKLFDHYDQYLEKDLLKELSAQKGNLPRKLLLIDYTVSGHSLGAVKQSMDYYFRYKSKDYKGYIDFASEYFAISHEPSPVELIQENIDSYKMPYPDHYPAKLEFRQESIISEDLSISSKYTVDVDMKERVQLINQNMGREAWHWKGEMFSLDRIESGRSIVSSFLSQEFDQYSPYGSWDLTVDNLTEKRRKSTRFKELLDFYKTCRRK